MLTQLSSLGSLLHLKIASILDRIQEAFRLDPTVYLSHSFFVFLMVFLSVYFIVKQNARLSIITTSAMIIAWVAHSNGDDLKDHMTRVEIIENQLFNLQFSSFFVNKNDGVEVPLLFYYSIITYIIPVTLKMIGIESYWAIVLTFTFWIGVFTIGLVSLTDNLAVNESIDPQIAYLSAVLLLTANYVYNLWLTRAALAEIGVYALVPWVVVLALRNRRTHLGAVVFLQICLNLLVFVHATACAAVAITLLSRTNRWQALVTYATSIAGAVLISCPFWLPQLIWIRSVLGVAALTPFEQSFLPPLALLDPLNIRTLGVFLPLSAVAILVFKPERAAACLFTVALLLILLVSQTEPLSAVVAQVPLLAQSQFVWRLMFPTAFIAMLVLLVAQANAARPFLAAMAIVSVAATYVVQENKKPYRFWEFMSGSSRSATSPNEYLVAGNQWGVALFMPNYATLVDACSSITGNSANVTLSELRRGHIPVNDYLSIRYAPIGFVSYKQGDRTLTPKRCGDLLVLGPVEAGVRVSLNETTVRIVEIARFLSFLLAVPIIWLFGNFLSRLNPRVFGRRR